MLAATCLVASSLGGCIRWTTTTVAPPDSGGYLPPQGNGGKVPAVIVNFTSYLNGKDHPAAEYNRDLFAARLREAGLFESVDTRPPAGSTRPRVTLIVRQSDRTFGGLCPLFGCSPLGDLLRWLTIVPALFSVGATNFESETTVTAINWEGTERTYRAAGRATWNANMVDGLFEPWGRPSFGQEIANSLFNQMARDLRLYTTAPRP